MLANPTKRRRRKKHPQPTTVSVGPSAEQVARVLDAIERKKGAGAATAEPELPPSP